MTRRGLVWVLSAPSGAGKSTLAKALRARLPDLGLSISVTTRLPRAGEQNGREYSFVSPEAFARMAADGALAEHARVHDNGYGTPKAELERHLSVGRDVLLDIDWQGGYQLRQSMPGDTVTVFILPPSMDELRRRLEGRGLDAPEVVERRLAAAQREVERGMDYDYVVVNDVLETCLDDLMCILRAERLRRTPRVLTS